MKRVFKGVWIPAEIWFNEDLTLTEKALLTEIDSLDNEDGCTAGNKYFADFFSLQPRMVSKYISRLFEKKLINVTIIGRTKRRIVMVQKFRRDGTKIPSPDGTKVPHSNTEKNKTEITAADAAAWDWNEYLRKMRFEDKSRIVNIVGDYFDMRDLSFPSAKAVSREIGRHAPAAKALTEYPEERVFEVMNWETLS